TLVFLGATDPALVPAIPAALQGAVRRNRSGELSLGAAGAFPSLAEPRTIWLAVSAPNGWLDRLQSGIVTAMADFGVVPDDRPFQPHITGGRIRRGTPRPGRRAIGQAVRAARPPAPIIWPVSNVVLYESVAGPDGPTYLELDTAC
ncbi:MAG: RNA 2',3'-cyclic phosphodiesterase, partial [Gemmatimonadales bacterium]